MKRVLLSGLLIINLFVIPFVSFAENTQVPIYERIPYQYSQGFSNLAESKVVTFPEFAKGYLLIIENVSFYAYAGGNEQRVTGFKLITNYRDTSVTHFMETTEDLVNIASDSIGYQLSRSLRLYTTKPLQVSFDLKKSAPLTGGMISISGYLLSEKSPSLSP